MPGSALLVIDVQRELFAKPTPMHRAEALLDNINTLVERAHAAGAPVVYVQHSSPKTIPLESDGWQLHSALVPTSADVMVRKTVGNSFEDTPLHAELKARGVDRVVITGCVTHGCVKATCLGALELGYQTTLVADAHSSYSKDAARLIEEWNKKLAEAGAQVIPAADVRF